MLLSSKEKFIMNITIVVVILSVLSYIGYNNYMNFKMNMKNKKVKVNNNNKILFSFYSDKKREEEEKFFRESITKQLEDVKKVQNVIIETNKKLEEELKKSITNVKILVTNINIRREKIVNIVITNKKEEKKEDEDKINIIRKY